MKYKTTPLSWKSLKTGNVFPFYDYSNHGKGGLHSGFIAGEGTITRMDLPKDEYPYTIIYSEPDKPAWMR